MKRRLVVLPGLVGCLTGAPVETVPTPAAAPIAPVVEVKARYEVVPAELGDADVLARIRHRARLRRYGAASLARDADVGIDASSPAEIGEVVPVIGETRTRIRVVAEEEQVRFAVWIDRRDVRKTVLATTELGNGAGEAGVWLEPGATITSGAAGGGNVRVELESDALAVFGELPARLVGQVWVAPAGAPPVNLDVHHPKVWNEPADPRPRVSIATGTTIRVAPDGDARPLAHVRSATSAVLLGGHGAHHEVELRWPQLRVRGFVPSSTTIADPRRTGSIGTGRGHGFGSTHRDQVDVAAGACLFDAVGGDVVGVQLAPSVRIGQLRTASPGWRMVLISTDWGTGHFYVHDLADDPQRPRLELCTRN
ncbi:MAG: hypothetical protein KF773_07000 [Deltaproteobacteria bacterium]|nr:hypothetical protein [Deltaproteobacteria bacterium]